MQPTSGKFHHWHNQIDPTTMIELRAIGSDNVTSSVIKDQIDIIKNHIKSFPLMAETFIGITLAELKENPKVTISNSDLGFLKCQLGKLRLKDNIENSIGYTLIEDSAKLGNVEGNYLTGKLIIDGAFAGKYSCDAQPYFQVAADQNHPNAAHELSQLMENLEDKVHYLTIAAKYGSKGAEHELAIKSIELEIKNLHQQIDSANESKNKQLAVLKIPRQDGQGESGLTSWSIQVQCSIKVDQLTYKLDQLNQTLAKLNTPEQKTNCSIQ